ncbi:hypothetical protein QO021_28820 (plasmid) [Pseudomonas amygdali pv. lachrymans]|nr:hypothetical protein [Pseudomonas amygdali]RMM39060.1 hypothetical protein ALQ79_200691 [Pseudomonas amygdali pv. lachrymans]WIO61563.1 hypothetical protein QO021_28820 [Pseudomonas amygdali pv. lachrymans]
MKSIATSSVLKITPAHYTALTSDESKALDIRNYMSVEAITTERHALTELSRARYETGDRVGLTEPSGHYMAGDAAGCSLMDWMTAAERLRFHLLGLALPTFGEERLAARIRIQARIASRRHNAQAWEFDSGDV